jgi:DNA polymerase phi
LRQDERDHYFGRLFGAEALVKSSILFSFKSTAKHGTGEAWERLVNIICGIAIKKPWLREQCGWLFCSCMKTLSKDFTRHLVQALVHHKLLRTPEGVAIWLTQDDANVSGLQMSPAGLWKHGSPLSKRDVSTLANIMKDAKPQQAESDDNMDSQGKAMWSPKLHFAWDIVLQELYQEASHDRVSFKDFWLRVVDRKCAALAHPGLMLTRRRGFVCTR